MNETSRRTLVTLSLVIAGKIGVAHAYGPCDADEEKLCASKTHEETVRACLHKKVAELSPGCKTFVQSQDAEWRKVLASWRRVKAACQKNLAQSCKDALQQTDEKMKTLQFCLMADSETLSVACKQDLNRHIRDFQPNIKPVE
jgi:hypothetical protein